MKCPRCKGMMSINNKGQVSCSTCDTIKKKIAVRKTVFNAFEFYKVTDALNIVVDDYLLPEEIDGLVKQGVEVKIK